MKTFYDNLKSILVKLWVTTLIGLNFLLTDINWDQGNDK